MNDKLSSYDNEEPTPIEIKDDNLDDETNPISEITKNEVSKGSLESKSNDLTKSSSNTKTSSKNFFFTDDSQKDKKSTTSRQTLSSYQQDIKRKDEENLNDQNTLKKEIDSKQENSENTKNDDANQNENSYNTNSTDSEIEADFSVSDKKYKNDQEFELKIFSADFSSSFTRIQKAKSEVEQIKKFILKETKRLQKEEAELTISERLRSEVALIAYAPHCTVRKKLFKMGLL